MEVMQSRMCVCVCVCVCVSVSVCVCVCVCVQGLPMHVGFCSMNPAKTEVDKKDLVAADCGLHRISVQKAEKEVCVCVCVCVCVLSLFSLVMVFSEMSILLHAYFSSVTISCNVLYVTLYLSPPPSHGDMV